MSYLEEYGLNSGQIVNKTKSKVFISKHLQRRKQFIVSKLGISPDSAMA